MHMAHGGSPTDELLAPTLGSHARGMGRDQGKVQAGMMMTETRYLTAIAIPPTLTDDGSYVYRVLCAEDGVQCGTIVTHPGSNSSVYITWRLLPEFRGKGLMFDAVAQFLPSLLERYHRIVAMIWTTNERSKQLAKRLGFHYEGTAVQLHKRDDGTWQDVEFWALVEGYPHG